MIPPPRPRSLSVGTANQEAGITGLIREALAHGRSIKIKARGGSMGRLIPDGSVVEIIPSAHAPRIGEVVAAARDEHLFIHRVVATDQQIHLKGDRRPKKDSPFELSDILGTVKQITTPRGWTMRLDTASAAVIGNLLAWWSKTRPRFRPLR